MDEEERIARWLEAYEQRELITPEVFPPRFSLDDFGRTVSFGPGGQKEGGGSWISAVVWRTKDSDSWILDVTTVGVEAAMTWIVLVSDKKDADELRCVVVRDVKLAANDKGNGSATRDQVDLDCDGSAPPVVRVLTCLTRDTRNSPCRSGKMVLWEDVDAWAERTAGLRFEPPVLLCDIDDFRRREERYLDPLLDLLSRELPERTSADVNSVARQLLAEADSQTSEEIVMRSIFKRALDICDGASAVGG